MPQNIEPTSEKTTITLVLEVDAGIIVPTFAQIRATASELTRQLEGLYHSPFTIASVEIDVPRPEQGYRESPEEIDEVAGLIASHQLEVEDPDDEEDEEPDAKVDDRPQNEKGQYLNKDGSVSKRQ